MGARIRNRINAPHRLSKHGAKVVDEVVEYENAYRLCYVRGPESILIGLAEKTGCPWPGEKIFA